MHYTTLHTHTHTHTHAHTYTHTHTHTHTHIHTHMQDVHTHAHTLICYILFREKKKYEVQIEKVVHMIQKKDREIASLKQVIQYKLILIVT